MSTEYIIKTGHWIFFRCLLALLLQVLVCQSLRASENAVIEMRVEQPAPIGYRVGDIISIKAELKLNDGWTLDTKSLPEIRRINRWLEVLSVDIDESGIMQAGRMSVEFRYLIVGNPEKLSALVVPPIDFNLVSGDESWPVVIGPTAYTLAPVLTHEVRNPGQLPELQMAEPPRPLDVNYRLWRMLALLGLFLLALLYLLFLIYGPGLLRARNKPFAKAVRELSVISRNEKAAGYRDALKVVHGAMRETYGSVVMSEDLDDFFKKYPVFSDCRKIIQAVYDSINAEFYDFSRKESKPLSIENDLLPLCRTCRRLECLA